LYKRALAVKTRLFGPNHPDVAVTLNNLGGLYHAMARHADGERCYRGALAIFERSLDPSHPKIQACRMNLARLLRDVGRDSEARRLSTRARQRRRRTLRR
jgi:hypothetical protein